MFGKLAFAHQVLYSLALPVEKKAMVGRILTGIAKKPLQSGLAGLGAYAAYQAGRAGWARRGAYQAGFDPAVQAWQSRPLGGG